MDGWFDAGTGIFRLDELVAEHDVFKKIMADGIVTGEELAAQSQRVLDLLRRAETELDEAGRDLVKGVLSELAVLYAVSQHYTLQQAGDTNL